MRTWSLRIDDHAIIDSFVQPSRAFREIEKNSVSDAQDASGKQRKGMIIREIN